MDFIKNGLSNTSDYIPKGSLGALRGEEVHLPFKFVSVFWRGKFFQVRILVGRWRQTDKHLCGGGRRGGSNSIGPLHYLQYS